jgi:heptosyltransferase-2
MEYEPKNILVRGVNWLGDSLVTIPALRTLRKIYPESRITLLIKEPLDELFPPFTAIDRVIGFSVRRGAGGLIDRLRLAGQLRRERFDLCVILPNSFDSALVPFLAGIPQRIGFSRDGRGMLLTKRVPPVPLGTGEHQAKDYLKLVTSLKQEATVMDFHLEVAEEAREWADETLSVFRKSAPNALIGFNPGAAYGPAKMWFPDRFTELGTRLWNGIGAGIVLVGGPGERELCRSIARKISGEVLDLSGRTSLPQLAAVLSLCDLVVTNDSGPCHCDLRLHQSRCHLSPGTARSPPRESRLLPLSRKDLPPGRHAVYGTDPGFGRPRSSDPPSARHGGACSCLISASSWSATILVSSSWTVLPPFIVQPSP